VLKVEQKLSVFGNGGSFSGIEKMTPGAAAISLLSAAYPRGAQTLPESTLEIYEALLSNYSVDKIKRAVQVVVLRSKFFPSIAEFREALHEEEIEGIPTAMQAWGEVRKAVEKYGSYRAPSGFSKEEIVEGKPAYKDPEYSHPLIGEAARLYGYRDICMCEDIQVTGAVFMKHYEILREKAIRNIIQWGGIERPALPASGSSTPCLPSFTMKGMEVNKI